MKPGRATEDDGGDNGDGGGPAKTGFSSFPGFPWTPDCAHGFEYEEDLTEYEVLRLSISWPSPLPACKPGWNSSVFDIPPSV